MTDLDQNHKPTTMGRAMTAMNFMKIGDDQNRNVNKDDRTLSTMPLFFKLPRELRDQIYDLVVLSDKTLYYEIALKAGEKAQTLASSRKSGDRADSRFETEYSEAVGRHIRLLMAKIGRKPYDRYLQHAPSKVLARFEVSKEQHAGSKLTRPIHALMLPVAVRDGSKVAAIVLFTYKFEDSHDSGVRICVDWLSDDHLLDVWTGLSWSTGCEVDNMFLPGAGERVYRVPYDHGDIAHQTAALAKTVNWKGLLLEYMTWQFFFARIVPHSHIKETPDSL